MMEKVPLNNAIIRAYQNLPMSGFHEIPFDLKKIIELVKKPKSPPPVFEDDSEEPTYSDVQGEDIIRNDEDDISTNTVVPIVSEPSTVETSSKVSTPQSLSIPLELDIFKNIINEPFLNISQTPPPPIFPTSTSLMTTSILISCIPPLPKISLVNTSQPHISIPLLTPIFIKSIMNPMTTSTTTPPEGRTFKSYKEENRSSNITGNTYDMESNDNIGVTTGNISSSVPNSNADEDVMLWMI
ncbi:unnamed protein product [Lactuca saligna]|uniref:Uncharacterized protein n=1 Tax=Lactuca saligna TaxID=75948 RepID=A0AA36E7C7_LACSI|nr:unnamed protein product [Lactuca saligna]